jgi:hypothetical protein
MTLIGYTMMCGQSGPKQLVRDVALADEARFGFVVTSDRYFPWLEAEAGQQRRHQKPPVLAFRVARDELIEPQRAGLPPCSDPRPSMPRPACSHARARPYRRHTNPTSCAGHGSSRKGRDARPFHGAGPLGKRCPSSVLPLPARKPRVDLLERPPVAIWIAERSISLVGVTLRVRARNTPPARWNTSLTSTPRLTRSSRDNLEQGSDSVGPLPRTAGGGRISRQRSRLAQQYRPLAYVAAESGGELQLGPCLGGPAEPDEQLPAHAREQV